MHKLKQFFHISNYLKIYTHIFYIYLMCGEGVQMRCPCWRSEDSFLELGALILLGAFWASNSGQQALQQAPLSPEPSRQL